MYKCLHPYKQFTEDKVFGMTVIEFFDRTPVENIISCLSMRPNKVILAGDSSDMSEHGRILKRVAAAHGLDIEISCVPVDRNNLTNAVSGLCGIIESEPGDFPLTSPEERIFCLLLPESLQKDMQRTEDAILSCITIMFGQERFRTAITIIRYSTTQTQSFQ